MKCPVCSKITNVKTREELPPNDPLRSALKVFTNDPSNPHQSKPTCCKCEKEGAYWCGECGESFYCDEHNSLVHSKEAGHKVEKAAGKSKPVQVKVCYSLFMCVPFSVLNKLPSQMKSDEKSPSTLLPSVANISITTDTPKPHQLQGIVDNFAGSDISGTGRVDKRGNQTKFSCPWGCAIDTNENIFVTEYGSHQIRKVTKEGVVTIFAGSGKQGDADGTGTLASFSRPLGITVDAEDNLYVADYRNHRIRKITKQGVVSTIAGSFAGFSDGVGSHAKFSGPYNIAVDLHKNLYVADSNNHRIRKITSEGIVSTIAGNGTPGNTDGIGTQAFFDEPRGIALDADGNLYVSDTANCRIRRISPQGNVTAVAGGSSGNIDGIGTNAQFAFLASIAIDASGSLLVADEGNHNIRKVTLRGEVSTVAGSSAGYSNGQGSNCQFMHPSGIAINSQGDVFVAEYGNHRIRKIV